MVLEPLKSWANALDTHSANRTRPIRDEALDNMMIINGRMRLECDPDLRQAVLPVFTPLVFTLSLAGMVQSIASQLST